MCFVWVYELHGWARIEDQQATFIDTIDAVRGWHDVMLVLEEFWRQGRHDTASEATFLIHTRNFGHGEIVANEGIPTGCHGDSTLLHPRPENYLLKTFCHDVVSKEEDDEAFGYVFVS